jgi:adenine-specific DNA-methyltransferase
MQQNYLDGGHRKFIMVQLPEKVDEKSIAYKKGYKNICEIGIDRIKKAKDYVGNERFLLTYGDGVSDVNISELIKNHEESGRVH